MTIISQQNVMHKDTKDIQIMISPLKTQYWQGLRGKVMLVSVDAKKCIWNSLNTLSSNNSHWAKNRRKIP